MMFLEGWDGFLFAPDLCAPNFILDRGGRLLVLLGVAEFLGAFFAAFFGDLRVVFLSGMFIWLRLFWLL